MAPPATLTAQLGDYLLCTWTDGRVVLETPAPVTLAKRLAMSVLLATASAQADIAKET